MSRRVTAALAATLSALALAACGGDDGGDDEAFREDFRALSDRIVALGEDVGNAIETAETASDQELADEFGGFAEDVGRLQEDVRDLEPPEDLADERDDLAAAMGEVRSSLDDIAQAAEDGDPQAAGQATVELIDRSERLRDARRTLADAVRDAE